MMYWIVQEDLFIENRHYDLIESLERFSIPYTLVTIGDNHELIPEINIEGPIVANGSILLSKIANERGWEPGSMFNENFDYEVWGPIFKDHLLNRDAIFTTIGNANPEWDEFFVRPLKDDKSFNGRTINRVDFKTMQERYAQKLEILIAPIKKIGQEHRHYIVDGRVVTSSRYKLGGLVNYDHKVDSLRTSHGESLATFQGIRTGHLCDRR